MGKYIKQTTGFAEDVKRTFPNPLALFDYTDIQNAATQRPRTPSAGKLQFKATLAESLSSLGSIALDWDVDTKKEIVSWSDSQLNICRLDDNGSLRVLSNLAWDEGKKIRGAIAVDLYEVDFAARVRTKNPNQTAQQASRHDTVRDLLVFGDNGITVVSGSWLKT